MKRQRHEWELLPGLLGKDPALVKRVFTDGSAPRHRPAITNPSHSNMIITLPDLPFGVLERVSSTQVIVTSLEHKGASFGGSCHACCSQLQLSKHLHLALHTRGRRHFGNIIISFTTPPAAPVCTSASEDLDGTSSSVASYSTTSSDNRGATVGGQPCTYREWLRLWGPDVTTRERVIKATPSAQMTTEEQRDHGGQQTVLEGCGVSIKMQLFGRFCTASLLVLDAPMRSECTCCRMESLSALLDPSL